MTSSLRGGQNETVKKKKEGKNNINSVYYSFLFFIKKQSFGTLKKIFNFLVNRLIIVNSLCYPRAIETFYDHPCFFFQVLIKSTIQDACNGLRCDNFEVIFTSVGSTPRFSCVTTSFENHSLYMF